MLAQFHIAKLAIAIQSLTEQKFNHLLHKR